MTQYEYMRHQVAIFCFCLFDASDFVEVRHLPCKRSRWFLASELASDSDLLWPIYEIGESNYVGANPRKEKGGKSAEDVALARCMLADFDGISVSEAIARCSAAELPLPTMTINSGHGCHTYWRLTEPVTDLSAWSALQIDLSGLLGSDQRIKDPPRVMRLPGFLNRKESPAVWCHIVDADWSRRYAWDSLRAIVPPAAKRVAAHRSRAARAAAGGSQRRRYSLRAACLGPRIQAYLAKIPGAVSGDDGHKRTFSVACKLVLGFELTPDEAMPYFAQWNRTCAPPWNEDELIHKLVDAHEQQGERGFLLQTPPNSTAVSNGSPTAEKKKTPATAARKIILGARK